MFNRIIKAIEDYFERAVQEGVEEALRNHRSMK